MGYVYKSIATKITNEGNNINIGIIDLDKINNIGKSKVDVVDKKQIIEKKDNWDNTTISEADIADNK